MKQLNFADIGKLRTPCVPEYMQSLVKRELSASVHRLPRKMKKAFKRPSSRNVRWQRKMERTASKILVEKMYSDVDLVLSGIRRELRRIGLI